MLLETYGSFLTNKQFNAMQSYYAFDYSLAEIGENLSISRQAVSDAIKQGLETLEKMESKLHLLDKKVKIKDILLKSQCNQDVINEIIYVMEE